MTNDDVNKLLDKLGKAHRQSVHSLGAYYRAGVGTRSATTNYDRYERAVENFEKTLAELRTKWTEGNAKPSPSDELRSARRVSAKD